MNYKIKKISRTDSIASTTSTATTNSSKSISQVKQKEEPIKLKIKKNFTSAQAPSETKIIKPSTNTSFSSLVDSILNPASSRKPLTSNDPTSITNQINFKLKIPEETIPNQRKIDSNKNEQLSIHLTTLEKNPVEKSCFTPKSKSTTSSEKSSSEKKLKKRARLSSPSSSSSESDFSPYQKPKKAKKTQSTDSNNFKTDNSTTKTNQTNNKISPSAKAKASTTHENKKEVPSKEKSKNENPKISSNNKTNTQEKTNTNNINSTNALLSFKIPKVVKVDKPDIDPKTPETNVSPKTNEKEVKKSKSSSSKKTDKKKKSSDSSQKNKQEKQVSSILEQENFTFLRTSPESNKQAVVSKENNTKLLTLSDLTEKRKQFSLGLNCAHPYFNLVFLFNDYVEKMKQAPFLNFVYLAQNLPHKSDNDHGLSVEKVIVNEKHRVGLCKLMSRSSGALNFYRMFGFGYDLREERSRVSVVPSEKIKIPSENCTEEDEINFVNSAVSKLTLSDAFIIYSHLKHRINTPFRAITVLFDGKFK